MAREEDVKARRWKMTDWYQQNRQWARLPPIEGNVFIKPSVAEASEPHTWTITYEVGSDFLEKGTHLAFEVPESWRLDLGRPFQAGIENIMLEGEKPNGWGAIVSAVTSRPEVELDIAISPCSRFKVVDIALRGGRLSKGDTVQILLGNPKGSKLRAQKYAQRAIFAMGVDLEGKGVYRRVASQPSVKVVGAWAASLKVIAPATVKRGKPFEFTVTAVDSFGPNPASGYGGEVEFAASTPDVSLMPRCRITEADGSIARVRGALLGGAGVTYITACDRVNVLIGRSNPMAVAEDFSGGLNLYFGDLHGQMYESIGTGDIDEYYQWGKDVERLDFCAPANHYGGRYEITEELWNCLVEATNRYYEPESFVTLLGFEWGAREGHRNVYYRTGEGPFLWGHDFAYNTLKKLWKALGKREVLTIPHHSKYISPTDWSFRNDAMQRLVEICSAWGISEERGETSVQVALSLGHRLGFVGGTDTHYGQPGHGPHGLNEGGGLVAVYAEKLTREGIYDALYNRHCYATNGERILLNFTLDGHRMGEEVQADELGETRNLEAKIAGTTTIDTAEIIRNNRVVHRVRGEGLTLEFCWKDKDGLRDVAFKPSFPEDNPFVFYYLRIKQRNRGRAWSSPIWINL